MGFQHFLASKRASGRAWLSSLASSSSPTDAAVNAAATPLSVDERPELPPIDAKAKRLFLLRHGEVINPGGDRPVYYGAMDVPLSPLGEQEAQAAALYLQDHVKDIDLVVSSPLSRAIYGADQVVQFLSSAEDLSTKPSRPLMTFEGFRELDRGAWCGLTKDEIGTDSMARFDACDESVTPEGGESYLTLKDRVLQARNEVLHRLSPGRAAVVVSHLQVTRSMLSEALNIATNEMAALKVATASVTCIDYYCDDDNDNNYKEESGNGNQAFRGKQIVRFQSFKPDVGLAQSKDGAN